MESWHFGPEGNGMCELPKRMRKFLPQPVDSLFEVGVNLTIWRSSGRADDIKLLYEPGYKVPFPHLEDVSQRLWAMDTFLLWEIRSDLEPRPNGLDEEFLAEQLSDDEEEPEAPVDSEQREEELT
jgi:hypothetical protein